MFNTLRYLLMGSAVVLLGYLLLWPVPIKPVAWVPPENPGMTGDFAPNDKLAGVEYVSLSGKAGPEGLAVHPKDGTLWTITNDGTLHRIDPVQRQSEEVAKLSKHPLELEFAPDGTLYFTDVEQGLMSWTQDRGVKVEVAEVNGIPTTFAEDVDVAADGTVYFTIATTRFNAQNSGTTMRATVRDLLEHRATGALFRYDPAAGEAVLLWQGGTFVNGMALSPDDSYIVFSEMAGYKLWRHDIASGETRILRDALPMMPDNVTWIDGDIFSVGMVAPRDAAVDGLAPYPFVRKMILRLPEFLQPAPKLSTMAIFVNGTTGDVVENLQDPNVSYPLVTGVTKHGDSLWLTSFIAPGLGRIDWPIK